MSDSTYAAAEATVTKDDVAKVRKAVRAEKPPATFGLLSLHWDFRKVILPYAKAIQLMALLEDAMAFKDSSSERPSLRQLEGPDIELALLPQVQVEEIKIAQILNIPLSELRRVQGQDPYQAPA